MADRKRWAALAFFFMFGTCTYADAPRLKDAGAAADGSRTDQHYSPVAPASALLYSARLNLKLVGDWLGERDFESAAETAERIALLIDLCELQSDEPVWRDRLEQFRSRNSELIERAKKQDAPTSVTAANACLAIVADLEASLPARLPDESRFTPRGALRTWMHLLDGCYTDAKVSRTVAELTAMSYTIAEAANAVQFLRGDTEWRDRARRVREAALKVSTLKPDTDLKVARQELKNVYENCQACHKAFKR
jgi:hypothetical protein